MHESPLMILASPGRIPICIIEGIDEHSVNMRSRSNNTDLLSFQVHKYTGAAKSAGYDWIDEQMELYVNGVWYCINNPPSTEFDSYDEIKTVSAESDEIKLLQYMLTDFAINTGAAHSYEYMYKQAHDPDSDKYYQVKFHDEDNPELSLLHIILLHGEVPGWKIGYVDDITVNPSDNKTFLPDEIGYFDVTEQSVYSFLTQEVATTYRCVFEFDTKNMLINVYRAESLGKDTNILLDFYNVQNSINISRDSQLVTVFDVKGEGSIDISYVNPVGGSLIEDLSFFCKKPYMTDILIQKYKEWVKLRDSYKDEYFNLTLEYHRLQDIISELTDRVPTDSATNDWTTASVEDLQEAYNTNMAIVKGLESKFQGTNDQLDLDALKASEDWELYESIRNYTIPAIVAALQNKQSLPDGTTDYGSGNYIQNPVPVSLGTTWQIIGDGTFSCVHLDDQPDFGMASGVKIITSEGAGIKQTEIKTTVGTSYCISVYVKPTSNTALKIIHQDSSSASTTITNYVEQSFNLTANTWQRVYCSFSAPTQLCDVIFYLTSGTATITGMQMELGTTPKLFSYYIYGDSELKAYETDWDLYGVDELEAKLAVYQNNVDIMTKNGYSIPWSEQSSYDEPYHTQLHQKYLDYVKLRDDCQNALNERIAERTPYEEEAAAVNQQRVDINTKLQKENFGTAQSTYEGFTEKELFTLNSLRNQQTYTNPNIVSTSLTTMQDIVYVQKTLYDDAMDRLYVEAHPQYTYADTVDNILALPEFSEFHDELAVNNFIRIAIDDSDTYVKLRVTEIESNPFTNENNLQIVFSNMVMYRSKRDDLAYLINDTGNTSSKGQVVGNTNNDVINYLLTPEVITKLFANSTFQAGLGGVAVGGSGSGGNINAEKIVAELVKADEGVFESITAGTGLFDYIDTKIINASELYADVGHFKDVVTGKIKAEEGEFISISADNAVLDTEFVYNSINAHLSASDIKTGELLVSDNVRIISENGRMIMNGQALQITGIDSSGNEYVGIQLGYDTSSTPSLILRDENGALLLTPTGITQNAIADELIINDMVAKSTLSKDRMAFNVATANNDGTIDIGTVVQDGKTFDQIYATFQDETLMNYAEIKQTSDLIYLLVKNQESGDYSSFELTDKAITAITNQFVVKSPDGKRTVISGGLLTTDAIKSNNYSYSSGTYSTAGTFLNLSDGSITSKNFAIDSSGNAYFKGTIYATNGEFTGNIKSGSTITCGSNFLVDSNGNMKATNGQFSGSITCGNYFSVTNAGLLTAKSGTIGGWTIGTSSLYNGTNSLNTSSNVQGLYLGTDGILSYNTSSQYVLISNGRIVANYGKIAGWNINSTAFYTDGATLANTTGAYIGTDGIRLGNGFSVGSDGNAVFNGNITGSTFESTETGNFSIDEQGTISAKNLSSSNAVYTDVLYCNEISCDGYIKTLTSGMTIYVNATTGDDSVALKKNAVFQTLQGAIRAIPKFMNGRIVKIALQTDIVENITISYFSSGRIDIYLSGHTIYGHIYQYSAACVLIYGGTISGSGSDMYGTIHPSNGRDIGAFTTSVSANISGYTVLSYLNIYGADNVIEDNTYSTCIYASGNTLIRLVSVNIYNTDIGAVTYYGGRLHSGTTHGIASKYGYYANGGGRITLGSNEHMGGNTASTYEVNGGEVKYHNPKFETGDASTSEDKASTAKTNKSLTVTSISANSILDYATNYAQWRSDNQPRVSDLEDGGWTSGNHMAFWFFGDQFEEMASQEVTKIEITYSRVTGGYSSAVTHYFYTHDYESQPSTVTPSYGGAIGSASLAVGATGKITITDSSLISNIISSKGICSLPPSQTKAYYSVLSGTMKIKFYYSE